MFEISVSELLEGDPFYLVDEKERALIELIRKIPQDQIDTVEKILSGFSSDDKK